MKAAKQASAAEKPFEITMNDEKLIDWFIGQELERELAFRREKFPHWSAQAIGSQLRQYRFELEQEYRAESKVVQFRAEALDDPNIAPLYVRPEPDSAVYGFQAKLRQEQITAPATSDKHLQNLSREQEHLGEVALKTLHKSVKLYNQLRHEAWQKKADAAEEENSRRPRPLVSFAVDEASFQRYFARPEVLDALMKEPHFANGIGMDEDALSEAVIKIIESGKRFDAADVLGLDVVPQEKSAGGRFGRPSKAMAR